MLSMLGVVAVSGILGILGVLALIAAAYAFARGSADFSPTFAFALACLFGWAILTLLTRIHDSIESKQK